MPRQTDKTNIKRFIGGLLIALVYIGVWQAAHWLAGSSLLLPSPYETVRRFLLLLTDAASWRLAGMSILRIMAGYALGVACGVLVAILCAMLPFAQRLLAPLKSIVKATPVTSFILLALLWMRSGAVPMFIAFLMVLPIVWTNVLTAIVNTDRQLIEMTEVFRVNRWKRLTQLYVPSVLPQFLAACTTSLGFAWKAGVAAEIIAQPKLSIGYKLYQAKLTIETVDLFAWTLMIILLSVLIERLLVGLIGRIRHD